jgi:peptide/nickel transport system substrate-binding protein
VLVTKDPLGFQYMGRFNHLHPPFDNPKIRQAALAAFRQEPFLRAQVGIKEFYKPCPSMFTCGTPYGSAKGSDVQSKSNMRKAQALLKASGYDGTPVVILKPTDLAAIQKLPDVGAQLLRQAGFKVDLQAMDWNTVVSRRAKKEPPSQGGWNMFFTAWVAPDIWNPLTNAAIGSAGEKSWFGWPSDAKIEELREAFARATDEKKKRELAEAIQARAFEIGTHAPLGEYVNPLAARKNVTGWVIGPGDIYWNVKKN